MESCNFTSKSHLRREIPSADEEDRDLIVTAPNKRDGKKLTLLTAASSGGGPAPPCCQVENCTADLTAAKRYHRRHKVCEAHSKAAVVVVAGLRQRFCQQCSRFHELSEFDEAKRSCRRRLAGHNERRRKSSTEPQGGGGNRCRLDQGGRMQISLSGKHFHIR